MAVAGKRGNEKDVVFVVSKVSAEWVGDGRVGGIRTKEEVIAFKDNGQEIVGVRDTTEHLALVDGSRRQVITASDTEKEVFAVQGNKMVAVKGSSQQVAATGSSQQQRVAQTNRTNNRPPINATKGNNKQNNTNKQPAPPKLTNRCEEDVHGSMYARTNIYIKRTRQYAPKNRLCVFINCSGFRTSMALILAVNYLILPIVSGVLAGVEVNFNSTLACLIISLVVLASSALATLVFCQHMYVVRWTMPWIWNLPVNKDLHSISSKHQEFPINDLKGDYLRAYRNNRGLKDNSKATVTFHILSPAASNTTHCAMLSSITYAVLYTLSCLWATATTIVSLIRFVDIVYSLVNH